MSGEIDAYFDRVERQVKRDNRAIFLSGFFAGVGLGLMVGLFYLKVFP